MSSPSSTRSAPRPSRHLAARLQHEWDHLSHHPREVRRARAWGWRFHHIHSLDDALAATGYRFSPTDRAAAQVVDGDEVLAELVHLARTDDLAARLLLQRLLPGIAAAARKHEARQPQRGEALGEALATAWTVIRTFPVERRPRFVAANMLRDIEYRTFVQPWRRQGRSIPQPSDTFDRTPARIVATPAAEELAELLDLAAQSGLADADLDLARRLGRGESTAQLALAGRVTDRTIRNHRERVAYRLRQVALACA